MTHRSRRRVLASCLSLTVATSALANHGPGTSGGGTSTASGETLRAGKFEFTWRTDWTDFDAVGRARAEQKALQHDEFDSLESALVQSFAVSYGVTDDVQIGAQLGWYRGEHFIDAEDTGGGVAESSSADPSGLTDLWLSAKWRVMHGPNGHVAFIGGVKLPTGDDDEKLDNGEKLEPSSQPGTGAVDFQFGAAWSRYLASRVTIDASGIYTLRGEHDDFTVGDRFDAGVALAYRLTDDVQSFPNWSVSSELLCTWIGKDDEDGEANPNSGGTTLQLALGARVRFDEHFAFAISPAVPILQDLNGAQVETTAKVTAALSFSL